MKKIGYDQKGFNWETVLIENNLHQQSKDIAVGVDKKNEKGGGRAAKKGRGGVGPQADRKSVV